MPEACWEGRLTPRGGLRADSRGQKTPAGSRACGSQHVSGASFSVDKRRGKKSALLGTGFRGFKCPGFSDQLGLFLLMWPGFAAKEPLQFRNGLYW